MKGVFATLNARAPMETMTTLEKMMLLHRVSILEPLDPDDLEECTLLAAERSFDGGQVLCRRGTPETTSSSSLPARWRPGGRARLSGERRVLGRTGGRGRHRRDGRVLDPGPRAATVTAIEKTRTLVLPGDDFRDLLLARPAMAQAILRVLVGRLREAVA